MKNASQWGDFTLLNVGIVGDADAASHKGCLKFWVNDNHVFSSFDKELGCRNGSNLAGGRIIYSCKAVCLPTMTCGEVLRQHSCVQPLSPSSCARPLYTKIDIEGQDQKCLESILELPSTMRPKYVSVEAQSQSEMVELMSAAGYSAFKMVWQTPYHHTSGPFGEFAYDYKVRCCACACACWDTRLKRP